MDSGQITAVVIIAIIMVASIIKASFKGPRHRFVMPDQQIQAENKRLHSEVEALKDRIKVLERIAVEKENTLAREIESLRDR